MSQPPKPSSFGLTATDFPPRPDSSPPETSASSPPEGYARVRTSGFWSARGGPRDSDDVQARAIVVVEDGAVGEESGMRRTPSLPPLRPPAAPNPRIEHDAPSATALVSEPVGSDRGGDAVLAEPVQRTQIAPVGFAPAAPSSPRADEKSGARPMAATLREAPPDLPAELPGPRRAVQPTLREMFPEHPDEMSGARPMAPATPAATAVAATTEAASGAVPQALPSSPRADAPPAAQPTARTHPELPSPAHADEASTEPASARATPSVMSHGRARDRRLRRRVGYGLLLLTAVAAGAAAFVRVDVVSEGRGRLRASGGPQPATVLIDGVLSELSVREGDRVEAGQALARVGAHELRWALERGVQEAVALREHNERGEATEQARLDAVRSGLETQHRLLRRRMQLKREQVAALSADAKQARALVERGAGAEADARAAAQRVGIARDELLLLRQQAAAVEVEINDRASSHDRERTARDLRAWEAEAHLREAQLRNPPSQVLSPARGRVQALLAQDGDAVRAGQAIAQVMPDGADVRAIVLVPAADAPYLEPGLGATLVFPGVDETEATPINATITRVATQRAAAADVAQVLGTGAAGGDRALVQVELTVAQDEAFRRVAFRLAPQASVVAQLHSRARPLGAWLMK